jgi:hypothetical protein
MSKIVIAAAAVLIGFVTAGTVPAVAGVVAGALSAAVKVGAFA